jgi:folate-binding protein YgfZ
VKLAPFRHSLAQASFEINRLHVSGADALDFLQGQSTQKVSSTWAFHAFLDRAGKIESHFVLWSTGVGATILVPADLKQALLSRFDRYVISEDVTVEDCGIETWWFAAGAGVPAKLQSTPFENVGSVSSSELTQWLRWQGSPSLEKAFHAGELINQTRLFEAAVDMKKGCFPGQEVVAKIHNNRGAAWAPVLLQKINSAPANETLLLEDKVVAKINLENEGDWYQADVLRDVRVEGLELNAQFKVKLYPRWVSSAEELYHLGTEAFAQGDEALARQAWELAIAIDATYADAYEAIGVLLGRQGQYVEAETWMRKLLEVDPASVMAHTNLSLFLMRQDRIQEAEDHKAKATVAQFAVFGKKAASDRAQKEALEKEEQQRQQREKMFLQVIEIDSEDALANFGLATLCLERNQFQKAKEHLDRVLATDPSYAVAYLGLGKALKALGEISEARRVWQEGVKIAAKKGEMMPANEMQSLLTSLD